MAAAPDYDVFVSYERADWEEVAPILGALRRLGIRIWVDRAELVPGDSWEQSMFDALARSAALLLFISPKSARRDSIPFREFQLAQKLAKLIVPVVIGQPIDVPIEFGDLNYVYAAGPQSSLSVAEQIAAALRGVSPENTPEVLSDVERDELAKSLVARTKGTEPTLNATPPDSVFLVHGHDDGLLREAIEFIEALGIKAIVLKQVEGAARSLLDKFFEIGGKARFAIVLLSADDMGASRDQFDEPGVGAKALKYRSRQNSILELGYFYGLLGWDKVFVLERAPPKKFPDFERPSDLAGVVFDRYDSDGRWKAIMTQRLERGGFRLAK